ncbi:hypothetical protein [Laspinema olomoucense]|uniref:Uncharacterized protein n=1 Tax=Laspinema olomoucense D3b TaxID=2953688 RepID=A0ABT2NFV6_9CYAN|nr:hypothetical protein [Laspinema sp. D3b]MCT7981598.1 hypothetical protein [Laspinema sp. D3b]
MATKCLLCNSDIRTEIDLLLLSGESTEKVAKICCDRGLKISKASVCRHTRHIEGYHPPKSSEIVDYGVKKNELQPLKFEISNELTSEKLSQSITSTYQIIIAGIEARAIAWAKGEGRFPLDEIKALQSYTDTISKLKDKTNFLNLENTFNPCDFEDLLN